MTEIKLEEEFIKLDSLLKITLGISGGMAKVIIQDGEVKVDGEVETRRGKKIYKGSTVEALGEVFEIEWS